MSVLLVLTSWSTPGLQAAVKDLDPSEARAVVTEVLASEEFGEKEQIQTWVYVGTMGEDRGGVALPEWLRDFFTLLAQGANPVAILMKWILVLLAVVVGVFVLRRILIELRGRRYKRSVATESYEEPQLIGRAGDQVPPADVEVRVHRLIAAGDLRAALALLYQATLFRLVQQFSLGIPASATELECLELVRRARPAYETVLLQNLIEAWRRLAYGHRAPDSDEVAALLRDWRQWQGSPGGV
jgi:hypothetical protein